MDLWTVVFFVVGVAGLVVGAEALVRGSSRLAARTGMSSVVIGLTVVAFGTSAPELAVSLGAAFQDEADIALGNVVGSNIANVLLVLGSAAVVSGGLVVAQRIVRIDVPLVIGASVLVLLFGLDNEIERWEGAVLAVALVIYITWTVVAARRGELEVELEYDEALSAERLRASSPLGDLLYVLAGLGLLVVGAQALVESATDIATEFGLSELVIGLTVVAIGTSLPEIATSLVAAARGQVDLAVGNAIGSNLFNLLAVLGVTAIASPSSIPVPESALQLDLPVMIAVAVACLPIFVNGSCLKRWEGAVFLGYYAAYLAWLVLDANDHQATDGYRTVMLYFVLPITAVTLLVVGYRAYDRASSPSSSA